MNFSKIIAAGLSFAAAFLIACGDDSSTQAPGDTNSSQQQKKAWSEGTPVKDADGNVYPTANYWGGTYMKKNLNVNIDGSFCYENKPENCEKYGRLYTWEAAQKACPAGWHLPSKEEFEELLKESWPSMLGSVTSFGDRERGLPLGLLLLADEGYDTFGFSALTAGSCSEDLEECHGTEDFYNLLGVIVYPASASFWAYSTPAPTPTPTPVYPGGDYDYLEYEDDEDLSSSTAISIPEAHYCLEISLVETVVRGCSGVHSVRCFKDSD